MIRKLCSIILLLSIIFAPLSSAFAQEDPDINFGYTKSAVMNMKNGAAYVQQLEQVIPTLKSEQLTTIQNRIKKAITEKNFEQYSALLSFINLSITKELAGRIFENTLTQVQKEASKKEILAMQKLLGTSIKQTLSDTLKYINTSGNYVEQGNFDMSLKLNIDEISIDSGLSLSNYTATTHTFDQELQGQIEAFLKGMIDGETLDINIQALLNFVMTEENVYLLMENLNLIDKSSDTELEEYLQPFIEKMQELASSKTYVSFEDIDIEEVLKALEQFSEENVNKQIDALVTTPLLEAYEMNGTGYMLKPTRALCDLGKQLSNVFDPFYDNKKCSTSQYTDLLRDMQDSGLSLILNAENENMFSVSVDNSEVRGNMNVTWDNNVLTSIIGDLSDSENTQSNSVKFSFIPNETFVFNFQTEDDITVDLDMKLSNESGISALKINAEASDEFFMNIDYANNTLDGSVEGEYEGIQFSCKADGQIRSDLIDITEKCEINGEVIGFFFPNENLINIDSQFTMDTRLSKNNFSMDIGVTTGTSNIIEFSAKNNGTRQSIDLAKIPVPIKVINEQEAFGEIYEKMYPDESAGYDPYNKIDEVTGESLICLEYKLNEETDYEDCVKYVADDYDYDAYYKSENGIDLYCDEYKYDEERNYDVCVNYVSE